MMKETTYRKKLNQVRADLDSVIPWYTDEPLPPQPSIIQPLIGRKQHIKNIIKNSVNPIDSIKYFANLLESRASKNPKKTVQSLKFKVRKKPKVSIVIPIFNKFDLTCQCLKSVQEQVSNTVSYEVIIVDNCSTDKSHLLSKVDGLIYIRNEENLGFVDGCNIGAKKAKGELLIFLNNDTLVQADWLESLVSTLENTPKAGLVGSKIVYPDGRLQEAGGVIFKDGSGNNYGKNDHPDRYQYNYVRDVDYCSGASIIIRKKLFDSFGGFDTLYSPAYYEDTDLAFKVRKSGLRVLYQPESVIYHIEGATAGTSTSSGFKKYQAINHKKFTKRWKETLKKQHFDNEELHIARDRSNKKMALIFDEHIPTPDQDSGSVRMYRIIESLQELGYKVTFFPNYTKKQPKYMRPLQQMGVEVVYGEIRGIDFLKQYGEYYDLVILSRPRIGSYYIDACQAYCKKATIIFDTVDLHYLRLNRQAEFAGSEEERKELKNLAEKQEVVEKFLISEADTTLVVSEFEQNLLNKEGYKNIAVVSNIHEVSNEAYSYSFDDRKDILFVGGFAHMPNIDAVRWFVEEIFSEVIKKEPSIKLRIVGSKMPNDLRKHLKSQANVIVDGFVENLEPLLKSSRVFIAPLRYGAGVKGKIGQAIEYGIPIVSTSIGGEGMHLKDRVSYLRADTEEKFAEAVVRLYSDKKLWSKLQSNARSAIEEHFSKETAKNSLRNIL